MQTALILIIALAVAGLLIWPPLAKSTLWRAMVGAWHRYARWAGCDPIPRDKNGPRSPVFGVWADCDRARFRNGGYMGAEYAPALRIRAMHMALLIATLIYMAYLLPLSLIFTPAPQAVIETAIIDMMGVWPQSLLRF